MFTCEICKSRNFLVLLNCHRKQWYSFICKSRNFLVLLNEKYLKLVPYDLQKQKFSCVTQQTKNLNTIFICKSRNFLVLLNNDRCFYYAPICKSRNFLVLLNQSVSVFDSISAKAEIFLCYSTAVSMDK